MLMILRLVLSCSHNLTSGPDAAKSLFEQFVEKARQKVSLVQTGVFQAMMQVHLVNDGPVTLIIESASKASQCHAHL